VSTEYYCGSYGDVIDIIREEDAATSELFEYAGVVNNLTSNVDRCTINPQGRIDGANSSDNTGTKPAGFADDNALHNKHDRRRPQPGRY